MNRRVRLSSRALPPPLVQQRSRSAPLPSRYLFSAPRAVALLNAALVLAVLLFLGSPAAALDVFQYDPVINFRFSHGTYVDARMEENPRFLLAGYDLSGLGWGPGNFGVTLISPRHFLTAAHVAPAPGSTVSFLARDGVVRHYVVESIHVIEYRTGVATDLVVGRLTAAVPPGDGVGCFPTLRLPLNSGYVGMTVYSFGIYQACGLNTIARWGVYDLLPFTRGDHVADDVMFVTEWHRTAGQAQAQGNDSGSPTFVLAHGRLALIGTHSAVDVRQEPYTTLDVLVPAYFTQIDQQLQRDGYQFGNTAAGPPESSRP